MRAHVPAGQACSAAITAACNTFGLDSMTSKSRCGKISRAREAVCVVIDAEDDRELATQLGLHRTAIPKCRARGLARLATDTKFVQQVHKMERLCKSLTRKPREKTAL